MLSKQIKKGNKLEAIIEENAIIGLYDALEKAGLSMQDWYSYGFNGWFLNKYGKQLKKIEYNKATKTFRWCTDYTPSTSTEEA